jgi:hypothetical protein
MAVHQDENGFRIEYPDGWQLVEEADEERHVVTVSRDETTFCTVTLLFDRPDPLEVLDAVQQALEDEFQDVDAQDQTGQLGGLKSTVRTMEFVCWDLTNSAIAHAARGKRFTLLVLAQFTDSEQAEVESVLQGIAKSLMLTE